MVRHYLWFVFVAFGAIVRGALHVALALHWFGSSIQQFTKPGMLSLGHAGVGRTSLALVVLCQCGIGLGSVTLSFAFLLCDGWVR